MSATDHDHVEAACRTAHDYADPSPGKSAGTLRKRLSPVKATSRGECPAKQDPWPQPSPIAGPLRARVRQRRILARDPPSPVPTPKRLPNASQPPLCRRSHRRAPRIAAGLLTFVGRQPYGPMNALSRTPGSIPLPSTGGVRGGVMTCCTRHDSRETPSNPKMTDTRIHVKQESKRPDTFQPFWIHVKHCTIHLADYLPMQNRPKIAESTSSGSTRPVSRPSASPARRRSSAPSSACCQLAEMKVSSAASASPR